MNEGPLRDATVIVTRPAHQADALCRAVERAAGRPLRFPTVEIRPPRSPARARARLARLRDGDWLIFVSGNAVTGGLALLPGGRIPAGVRVAAVGPATARAVRELAFVEPLLPDGRYDSEGLLARPEIEDLAGRRVVIAKAPGGRRLLSRTLRGRGAEVANALVYRRARPRVEPGELARRLGPNGPLVTTITSGELLANLARMVDARTLARLQAAPLVAAGKRVAERARRAGFVDVVAAAGPDPDSLVRAAAERLASPQE